MPCVEDEEPTLTKVCSLLSHFSLLALGVEVGVKEPSSVRSLGPDTNTASSYSSNCDSRRKSKGLSCRVDLGSVQCVDSAR